MEDSHPKVLKQESTLSPTSTHSNLRTLSRRNWYPQESKTFEPKLQLITVQRFYFHVDYNSQDSGMVLFFENMPKVAFKDHSPTEDEAMADPHPKVLKQESTIFPVFSSTRIWSFMTSPQAGAPTSPVPTLGSSLSKLPTLRGLL